MRNSFALSAVAALSAALAFSPAVIGQERQFDPNGSVKFNLPSDSPVSLISCDFHQSTATVRGGALALDVHLDLSLKNAGSRRLRGITLLIVSQESLPVGRASVSRLVDVGHDEAFPLRVDVRLMRPAGTPGPLVQVNLDGVLFEDLNFYGPNRLNSKRTMTFWEMEARRDRAYFKRTLAERGPTGLQDAVIESLKRQDEMQRLDVRMVRGRTTTASAEPPARMERFTFLNMPEAPVKAVQGWAEISGDEVRSPRIEIKNLSNKSVRYVEIAWLVKDKSGTQYVAGSVPGSDADLYLPAGQTGELVQDASLRFFRPKSTSALPIEQLVGVVNQVEYSDGKVWIPKRDYIGLSPSPEEQRLTDLYRIRGLQALMAELSKF
jgi:hypothetical protein